MSKQTKQSETAEFDSLKKVELVEIDNQFLSGETGCFAEETTVRQRRDAAAISNGIMATEEERRFADLYIYGKFNEVKAYRSVFDKKNLMEEGDVRRKAKAMLRRRNVVDYLDFLRQSALKAMSISDEAEFYQKQIVQYLYDSMQSDIYDYIDFTDGTAKLVDKSQLTKRQRQQVKKFRYVCQENREKGTVKTQIDIELVDKQKMTDLFMKHLKMFTKRGFGENTASEIQTVIDQAEQVVAEFTEDDDQ